MLITKYNVFNILLYTQTISVFFAVYFFATVYIKQL